jgi:hypothetical protein
MKRMRRKFKAMQRDINGKSVDWRTLYMEAKEAETGPVGGRKKTKETGKNNERREKEKQRRYALTSLIAYAVPVSISATFFSIFSQGKGEGKDQEEAHRQQRHQEKSEGGNFFNEKFFFIFSWC